jgi:NADPH:quinone reductase-like Zn-dependent oxidoreductase
LRLAEVEAPVPGDDEVLVRVRAAEATKADCELRSFRFAVKWFWLPLRLAVGIRRPRKQILGGYLAGEVVAVGRKVTRLGPGEAVYGSSGLGFGGYGEYVALPSSATIVPKPTNMSFEQAAAVPLGGLNALHFMRRAAIQAGERVLIIGAGGSIGTHAVQIAKTMGAEVTAVDKASKEEGLRRLGADQFVDYTKERFEDRGETYDVIFDMVPTSSYSACMRALRSGGRYLTGNPRLATMLRSLFTNGFTKKSASFAFARETRAELSDLTAMIEAGEIGPIVHRVYAMDQAAEAHRRVEAEERVGAIVISLGGGSDPAPSST